MVKPPGSRLQRVNSIVLIVGLGASAALLGVLLHVVLDARDPGNALRQAYFTRLAYLVGALLILSLGMLAMVVIHHVLARADRSHEPFRPMGYVDAWTEAGRRLRPEDAPPVTPYEAPDEPEEDGHGEDEER